MSQATTWKEAAIIENARYHTFFNLAMALAVLTGIEIVIIFLPWASWLVMTVLVVLSIVKFFAVILWFMHLIYDKQLLFWLFMAGMILATGTMIALLALFSIDDVDLAEIASIASYAKNLV
ncbi:cytochrome C oxidase subunit IV family protein [Cerasicoccus fimbriatus]|uniref:cytochrome C oxidase subunit IV family protein n=1 Tax=Cerasicoccus fimbriatus TaxID=3014554 RepID=UPI0022B3DF7A|nr:cytochrome C oxidase subunit IV family protein [Cerasicoccus sp. TK19100]